MEYALRTKNLSKKFSKKLAIDSVGINIKKGDIYGLIGKNGAGKTTLIRTIVGLAAPTAGEIELFESTDLKKQRYKIGTVIESPAVYPNFTAKQNLIAQQKLFGKTDINEINQILEIVGLADTGKKKAKNFSLGMKQRLAIAISLIGNPEFLVLDEPINGLDPAGIKDVRDLILKLNKENNITVLISSHILGELAKIATRYGVICNGKLVDQFTPQELQSRVRKCLAINVDNTELTSKIIKESLNTNNYEIKSDKLIYLYDNIDEPSKVNTLLVTNGVIVNSINTVGDDYEPYLIKLMEGSEND